VNAARRAFGERLRRQRERQKVSLETIARTTKVTAALFAGLERGDCRRWPGGVYSRSFIRAYAEAVKLDPDQTAADFAELYDLPDAPETPGPQPIRTGPPLRLTLDSDPVEYWSRTFRRAAVALAEVVAVVALAAAASLAAGWQFWICVSVASIAWQIAIRAFAGSSPLKELGAFHRGGLAQPGTDAPLDDTSASKAASTIA
jgi:transcriptional regulator with XRE-family HTH domain